LLGECTIKTSDIFDLQEQAKEFSLLLELGSSRGGLLRFQTRFLPEAMTSVNFHLYENTKYLVAPESYLHFKSLVETQIFDRFNYRVPLGAYYWKDHI